MTIRILAICGSLQAPSSNLELLETAAGSAPSGVEVVIFDGRRRARRARTDVQSGRRAVLQTLVEAIEKRRSEELA